MNTETSKTPKSDSPTEKHEFTPQFVRFWGAFPNKKAKGAAYKTWVKITKGMEPTEVEALTNQIILAIDAQKRYRRAAAEHKEFVPDWKHPQTWLNGMCWEDEIPSFHDLHQRHEEKECSTPGCSNHTTGPRFDQCQDCFLKDNHHFLPEMREYYKTHGLVRKEGETKADWIRRLMADAKQSSKKIRERLT